MARANTAMTATANTFVIWFAVLVILSSLWKDDHCKDDDVLSLLSPGVNASQKRTSLSLSFDNSTVPTGCLEQNDRLTLLLVSLLRRTDGVDSTAEWRWPFTSKSVPSEQRLSQDRCANAKENGPS